MTPKFEKKLTKTFNSLIDESGIGQVFNQVAGITATHKTRKRMNPQVAQEIEKSSDVPREAEKAVQEIGGQIKKNIKKAKKRIKRAERNIDTTQSGY